MTRKSFFSLYDSSKNRDLLKHGRLYILLGAGWCVLTLLGAAVFGINWGIDFAGGMEMQVKLARRATPEAIRQAVEHAGFAKHQVQQYGPADENEWLVRVERVSVVDDAQLASVQRALAHALRAEVEVSFDPSLGDRFSVNVAAPGERAELEEQRRTVLHTLRASSEVTLRRTKDNEGRESNDTAVVADEPYQGRVGYLVLLEGMAPRTAAAMAKELGELEVRRVDFVDATVAHELKTDGFIALGLSLLLILFYVAVRFDMFFAPGALIALLHDPIGALAVFVVGRLEFDVASVAALLTTVGYSISHTIVIYDRVRHMLPPNADHETVRAVVKQAVNDTLSRTINTTVTVLLTTVSIFFLVGGPLRAFAAVLTVGCAIGAYSSAFMAPTFYLWLRERFYTPPKAEAAKALTREERERGVV